MYDLKVLSVTIGCKCPVGEIVWSINLLKIIVLFGFVHPVRFIIPYWIRSKNSNRKKSKQKKKEIENNDNYQ